MEHLASSRHHVTSWKTNLRAQSSVLSAAQCVARLVSGWEAARRTLQLRGEKAQGSEGEAWKQCSNPLLVQEVHWEKHPKQLLLKVPINRSKADLPLQQEIPTNYLLLSCHLAAFIRFTCFSAQRTAVSVQLREKHITNNHPVRRTAPPRKTAVSLVPSWSVLSAQETFSSQEITWTSPPRPASLKQLGNQLKSFGRGEGDQSVCGNGAWPQIASQLCHTAVSLSTLPTPTDRSCTRKDSNHATA